MFFTINLMGLADLAREILNQAQTGKADARRSSGSVLAALRTHAYD